MREYAKYIILFLAITSTLVFVIVKLFSNNGNQYVNLDVNVPIEISRDNVMEGQHSPVELEVTDLPESNLILGYNPTAKLSKNNKSTDLWIQNSNHNKLSIQVHVVDKETKEIYYVSPLLHPNEYIENIKLDNKISSTDKKYDMYTYMYKYVNEDKKSMSLYSLQMSEVSFSK